MAVTIQYADILLHPLMVLGYDWNRAGRNIIHDTIEGQAVTLRRAGLRQGTLIFLFEDEAAALDAEDAHTLADVFTLADTERPGVGMRYVVAPGGIRTALDPRTRERWTVEVEFRQVP